MVVFTNWWQQDSTHACRQKLILTYLFKPIYHVGHWPASCLLVNVALIDSTVVPSGCYQGHMVARGTYNELQGSGLDFTSLLTERQGQEEKQDPSTIPVFHGHHDNSASSLSSLSSSQHSLFDGGESQAVVGISETWHQKNIFQACFKRNSTGLEACHAFIWPLEGRRDYGFLCC